MDRHAASQDQKIMPMLLPEDILVTLLSDGPASVCSQQLGKHFSRDMPCVNVFPSILNPADKWKWNNFFQGLLLVSVNHRLVLLRALSRHMSPAPRLRDGGLPESHEGPIVSSEKNLSCTKYSIFYLAPKQTSSLLNDSRKALIAEQTVIRNFG